ncbi:MAG TPA: NifB/NifX family molybdenum-iron cluster-binding protein [Anaerolineales bacterium]
MTDPNAKIAFVVEENRATISAHFGRAQTYLVVTLEDGQIAGREFRAKHVAHRQEHDHEHDHHHNGGQHHGRHQRMVEPIADCQLLVAGGMGMGAHGHLTAAGIQPLLTDHKFVEDALEAHLAGTLENRPERLHAHGGGQHHD